MIGQSRVIGGRYVLNSGLFVSLSISFCVAACGDGGSKKRPLGGTCEAPTECESGFCADGKCLDPEGDEDLDTLSNALEVELGTDVFLADSDADGVTDPDELNANLAPKDTDGDGLLDAIESAKLDTDLDCIPDELDLRNTTPDAAPAEVVAATCPTAVGVCATSPLRVMCREGLGKPACELAEISGYEAVEAACDGLDNDCDDATDEGCDPLLAGLIGHWKLDGDGQDASVNLDHGTVTGATVTADRFGNANGAMRFGAPDHIDVPATEHPVGEVSASYAVWVRPDAARARSGVFSFGAGSGLALSGARHCASYLGGPSATPTTSATACAPAGFWSLLVVVKNGRNVATWLDGRPQGATELPAGQDLTSTALVIGDDFVGALDDLRAWDRALTAAEIDRIFLDSGWTAVGSANHPGHTCLHIRDAGRAASAEPIRPTDGTFTIDLDGQGGAASFGVYCDMTLDGGGWTLAWVYGMTNSDQFISIGNAVTPIPTWPAARTTSPKSTTPPTSPTTPGAIDFALWSDIGRSFAVLSDLTDGIACEPDRGSLSDAIDGHVVCRTIVDSSDTCQGVVPRRLFFNATGPVLAHLGVYFHFDGDSASSFPAHDPCAENSNRPAVEGARAGGALYLRETDTPVRPDAQCADITGVQAFDGLHTIDPDGPESEDPFEVTCDFATERGGWTLLSSVMQSSIDFRPEVARDYLFRQGDAFYVTPAVTGPWSTSFTAAPGRWVANGARGAETFDCAGELAGTTGIGCADPEAAGVLASGPLDDGVVDLCQAEPDAFGTGETCAATEVWVRERVCVPDAGSLFGDGELDGLVAATYPIDSACWYANGRTGWKRGFSADYDEVPPGGKAPSMRVSRPTTPTLNPYVELGQPVTLVGGKAYTLSFWAKADVRSKVALGVYGDSDYIYYEDLTLTPEWKRYEVGFHVPTTSWHGTPWIGTRAPGFTFWVDGFRLTEDGPSPCDGDGTNLVGNGDFSAGTTCWWPGNSDATVKATFDIEKTGGPGGIPAWRIASDGAPSEKWHVQTRNLDMPIEANHRYRLSFWAKSSEQRSMALFVARFDMDLEDPPVWFGHGDQALTTTWRYYTRDFVTTFASTDVLASMSFDFGWTGPNTVWLADVSVVKLETDPCVSEDGVANPGFDHGFACWSENHHWETVDLDVSIEDGVAVADIISNSDEFTYAANIRTTGLPLVVGNVYEVRARTRADSAREGYWNLQNYPSFYAGNRMLYDTNWRDFSWTFKATEASLPTGAEYEFGFAGPGVLGRTYFDDVAMFDHGPDGCTPTVGLLPNVGFFQGQRCWNVGGLEGTTVFAMLDTATFGNAAPSLRLEVSSNVQSFDVWAQWQGLQVQAGVAYRVTFKARANVPTRINVGIWEPPTTSVGYGEQTIDTTWQTYTFDFTSPITAGPAGSIVSFNVGDPSVETIWLDDATIELIGR